MEANGVVKQCNCKYSAWMALSCLIGVLLSAYASYVEINIEHDHNYRAMCDISEKVSCTKVFSSSYGKGFGLVEPVLGKESMFYLPNGMLGIYFYILIALLGFINNPRITRIQVILCIISNLLSLYLAYLLYFVLEDFCVVCVSTYAVNLANLIIAWKRYSVQLKEKELSPSMVDPSSKKVD